MRSRRATSTTDSVCDPKTEGSPTLAVAARGIEGKPVRLHTHADLDCFPLGLRRKYRDSILTAVGCKNKPMRLRDEGACHPSESGHRFHILILGDVDHIECVI